MVHQADDVGGADFDGTAVHHHVYGVFEGFPEIIWFVDVLVAELCGGAEDGLVKMLEQFLEEGVGRHSDADFGALHVQTAGDVWVCRENEGEWAGNAGLHDVEGEVIHAGVVGSGANVRNDEGHEELLHRLLQGIELVDCLRGFCVTADGIAGFGGVQNKAVVFQGGGGKLYDTGLRV